MAEHIKMRPQEAKEKGARMDAEPKGNEELDRLLGEKWLSGMWRLMRD